MKLIDILARELKVWPEGIVYAVQDFDGKLKFDNSLHLPDLSPSGKVWIRHGFRGDSLLDSITLAADWNTTIVTHAQWQSAVDALAAQDMHEVALGSEPGITAPAEWNGEGLPPVGTVCEFQHRNAPNGQWHPTTIRYSSHAFIVYVDSIHDIEECWRTDDSCGIDFRPIRTAEQIAAEDRASEIIKMTEIARAAAIKYGKEGSGAAALYDAGYRNQVAK